MSAATRFAKAAMLVLFLGVTAAPCLAVDSIFPAFQGSIGTVSMSSGVIQVLSSAAQSAASIMAAGAQTIQGGFLGFLSALTTPSQSTVDTSGGSVSFVAPAGPATVVIPPGAFATGVTVLLSAPSSYPGGIGSATNLTGTGVGVEITLDRPVQPAINVRLSVSYRPSDVVGLDQSILILARFDTTQNVWVPLVSSVDALNRIVTAQTNHFSTFQIMAAAPSNTVSTAKAFPNPLRPSQGQTYMTFSSLPALARIRIYNLKGAVIKEMTADASGMANWNGTNHSGAAVASGVYFVFAQGAGQSRTLKVAVQR